MSQLPCHKLQSFHVLMLEEFPGAGIADLEAIAADFFLGQARFELILGQKTQCWTVLPWKLGLLADQCEQTATRSRWPNSA